MHDDVVWNMLREQSGCDITIAVVERGVAGPCELLLAAGLQPEDIRVAEFLPWLHERRHQIGINTDVMSELDLTALDCPAPFPCSLLRASCSSVDQSQALWLLLGSRHGQPIDPDREVRLRAVLSRHALSRSLDAQRAIQLRYLEGVTDSLSVALMLLDRRGHLLWNNEVARQMLRAGDLLSVSLDGRLLARQPGVTHVIWSTLARPASNGHASASRPHIIDLRGSIRSLLLLQPLASIVHGDVVLAAVPQLPIEAFTRQLAGIFGLLPSEARFLATLVRQGALTEASAALHLSPQSARTYLKRIYGKLGIGGQLELAVLLAGLTPPICLAIEEDGAIAATADQRRSSRPQITE
ncbi:helix-turn-helix transcriptional regulator [Sphingomonas guangdongensis]|uniref:helix-turn-helix transcriptional regulator n=1 Tax=Sphingomonas guangdongensis TaxID=1141890 RepID=UPI0011817C86|nr:hypothetical protein [Sphingomonas guangdongensis]